MVTPEKSKLYTMDEFKEFVTRPENADRLFELINGEISEVLPGRTRYSEYREMLSFAVRLFCREQNLPCHTPAPRQALTIFWVIRLLGRRDYFTDG